MPVNSCVYNVGLWIQKFTGATKKAVKTLVVSKFNRKFAFITLSFVTKLPFITLSFSKVNIK